VNFGETPHPRIKPNNFKHLFYWEGLARNACRPVRYASPRRWGRVFPRRHREENDMRRIALKGLLTLAAATLLVTGAARAKHQEAN